MDFEEFCWAMGDESSCELLRKMYQDGVAISQSVHQKTIDEYRLYLSLDGMPLVVATYLESNSFSVASAVKKDICKLYVDNLRKHDNQYGTTCLAIYQSMLSSLHSWSRRVKTDIRSEGKKQKHIRSLSDLEDSRIVNAVHHCKDLSLGNLIKEETIFKLYPLDVGLMLETLLGEEGLSSEEAHKKIRFGKLAGANSVRFTNVPFCRLWSRMAIPFITIPSSMAKRANDMSSASSAI